MSNGMGYLAVIAGGFAIAVGFAFVTKQQSYAVAAVNCKSEQGKSEQGKYDYVCHDIRNVTIEELFPHAVAKHGAGRARNMFGNGQIQCRIPYCTVMRWKSEGLGANARRERFREMNPCCQNIGGDPYNERHDEYGYARRIN